MPRGNADAIQTTSTQRTHARRELAAEQLRVCHYRKALACAENAALRQRWSAALETSRQRATTLATMLAGLGEPVSASRARGVDSRGCLLDAMEMALSNGDMTAAETVALECMRLIDAHCEQHGIGARPAAPRPAMEVGTMAGSAARE